MKKVLIHSLEPLCPSENHNNTRNIEKSNKYDLFLTDIPHFKRTVNCFEMFQLSCPSLSPLLTTSSCGESAVSTGNKYSRSSWMASLQYCP